MATDDEVLFDLPLADDHEEMVMWKEKLIVHEREMKKPTTERDQFLVSTFAIQRRVVNLQNSLSRLAIPINVAHELCNWNHQPTDDKLFEKLDTLFPHLRELICILTPQWNDGDTLDELMDVEYSRGPSYGYDFMQTERKKMRRLFGYRKQAIIDDDGLMNIPELKFMRRIGIHQASLKASNTRLEKEHEEWCKENGPVDQQEYEEWKKQKDNGKSDAEDLQFHNTN